MYAWSSGCCVGQAREKGLVNLFGTLGWQGTCRQVKVPAQSYVSTAVLKYRLHCNTRDMEGKASPGVWVLGMGMGMGMGQGPEPGPRPRPGTGDWDWAWECDWDWGLGTGKQEKVGSRL